MCTKVGQKLKYVKFFFKTNFVESSPQKHSRRNIFYAGVVRTGICPKFGHFQCSVYLTSEKNVAKLPLWQA